jgi:hypothetical protein
VKWVQQGWLTLHLHHISADIGPPAPSLGFPLASTLSFRQRTYTERPRSSFQFSSTEGGSTEGLTLFEACAYLHTRHTGNWKLFRVPRCLGSQTGHFRDHQTQNRHPGRRMGRIAHSNSRNSSGRCPFLHTCSALGQPLKGPWPDPELLQARRKLKRLRNLSLPPAEGSH